MNFARTLIRLLALLLFASAFVAAYAAEPMRDLDWDDLRPPEESEPPNPFERLTPDQTDALRDIVRARALERIGFKIPEEGRERLAQMQRRLVAEGVDVDALLAERDAIIRQRTLAAETPVKALDGATVRLPGYVLPLDSGTEGSREFLLVPWVGACSHTPPPPPNQVVRFSAARPHRIEGLFAPVTIRGRLVVRSGTESLDLIDGKVSVRSVYAMDGATVESIAPDAPAQTTR